MFLLSRTARSRLPAALLLGLPIFVVLAVLFSTLLPYPHLDDYENVLNFGRHLQQLGQPAAQIAACFTEQQAEYRFVLLHILVLLDLRLFGHLSFLPLLVLGDLLLLPMLFVLAVDLFPSVPWPHRLPLLLPVAFLACQLTYAEVFNFATGSWNAFAVVPFALLTLHALLRRSSLSLAGALTSFALALAAATNGIFLVPIGLLLLWAQHRRRELLIWLGGCVLVLGIYFLGYRPAPHPAAPSLRDRLLFFLSFLGGAVEDMHREPVHGAAIALGLLLLVTLVSLAVIGYGRENLFALALGGWVCLTALTVAQLRSFMGLEQSLSGRYKLYCTLLLLVCYALAAERVRSAPTISPGRKRLALQLTTGVTALFWLSSVILGTRFLVRRDTMLTAGMLHFLRNPATNIPLSMPGAPPEIVQSVGEQERQALAAAITSGLYTPSPPQPRELPRRMLYPHPTDPAASPVHPSQR